MDRFEEGLEKLQEIKGEVKDKIKSVKGGDHSFFVALWDNWIKFGRSLDRLPLVEISNWCFENHDTFLAVSPAGYLSEVLID